MKQAKPVFTAAFLKKQRDQHANPEEFSKQLHQIHKLTPVMFSDDKEIPGEKPTAPLFKSGAKLSYHMIMKAIIDQSVFCDLDEARRCIALCEQVGLKLVEWTP